MLQVQEAVDGIAAQQWEEDPGQVPKRHLWGRGWGWDPAPWAPPGSRSASSPAHTWSSRLAWGNFQVALGTLDSAR